MKAGSFNYDLIGNAKRQHIVPNIKDTEFLALSPQNSAVLVKTGEVSVDVLDGITMDQAFSMKTNQAKCIFLA